MVEDILLIQKELKKKLSPKRYYHSVGVKYMAAALAMRYGIDVDVASIAGILHDCAKYMPDDEILEKCIKYNLTVSDEDRRQPQLLHGKLGAYYAETKYNVMDGEILEAIRCHTTGKPNMTLLEKILFISDYIEPNRKKIKGIDEVREVAFIDIDSAVIKKLENMKNYLQSKDIELKGIALETFNYYVR